MCNIFPWNTFYLLSPRPSTSHLFLFSPLNWKQTKSEKNNTGKRITLPHLVMGAQNVWRSGRNIFSSLFRQHHLELFNPDNFLLISNRKLIKRTKVLLVLFLLGFFCWCWLDEGFFLYSYRQIFWRNGGGSLVCRDVGFYCGGKWGDFFWVIFVLFGLKILRHFWNEFRDTSGSYYCGQQLEIS